MSQPLTEEQKSAIASLRASGYAVNILSPVELKGVLPRRVEASVSEKSNEMIGFLSRWVDPDGDKETDEVELVFDDRKNLIAYKVLENNSKINVNLIPSDALEGSYIHKVLIGFPLAGSVRVGFVLDGSVNSEELIEDSLTPSLRLWSDKAAAQASLESMRMGYGADLEVRYFDSPQVTIKAIAIVDKYKIIQGQESRVSSKWTHIADAGDQKIWIARSMAPYDLEPTNLFQSTRTATAPSNASGGYPNMNGLLFLKSVKEPVIPNKNYPPQGYLCASEHTKDTVPGAIYEKVFSEPDTVSFWMTIAHNQEGNGFIPIHGSVKMEECESAVQAGQDLQQYWDDLPDSSKRRYIPPSERQSG